MSIHIIKQRSDITAKLVAEKTCKAFSERGPKHCLVEYADRTRKTNVGAGLNELPYYNWTCLH
jgi:hypothetical protein